MQRIEYNLQGAGILEGIFVNFAFVVGHQVLIVDSMEKILKLRELLKNTIIDHIRRKLAT